MLLGDALFLFDFENAFEAERVWRLGVCLFKGKSLHLKWWSPKASCYREWCAKDCWVRLVELPLHLWGKDFFKRVSDACGGFMVVDVDVDVDVDTT